MMISDIFYLRSATRAKCNNVERIWKFQNNYWKHFDNLQEWFYELWQRFITDQQIIYCSCVDISGFSLENFFFFLLSSKEAIITLKCVKYHRKAQFITWPDSIGSRLMHSFNKCYLGFKMLEICGSPETGGDFDNADTLLILFIMTCK